MRGNPLEETAAETRKLAAIMFTDIVGFSHQMGSNETRMLRVLEIHNQLIRQAVSEHHGHVIKTMGDGFLVDFPSVVHAVHCAQAIQAQCRIYNTDQEPTTQMHLRIGIHLGDIVQHEGDVFGDGVNIASRLQTLAKPDTICISDVVYRDVAKKVSLGAVTSLGRPKLKGIAERFQVYTLLDEKPEGFARALQTQWLKLSRRVGTVVLVSVVLLGGIVTFLYSSLAKLITHPSSLITQEAQPPLSLLDKPSLVVLPFVNMSGDPEQEYFSDGITEDITADLSKISAFFVIARNSAFTYKGKAVKVQDVSREMGVRYILEGSVRKVGEQVRVTAQLIDGPSGGHVWSERYDRPLTDIFAVQDEIVQQLVTTLQVEVQEAEQHRVQRIPTTNLTAYDALLRAQVPFHRVTPEGVAQARPLYEQAIALDPQYAEAYAWLGWTYWEESHWNPDPQKLEQAVALAQKAIALDDSLAVAHSLVSLASQRRQQSESAITEGKRAVALDPNSATSAAWLGEVLNYEGRPAEAIGWLEKAMRLDPRFPFWFAAQLGLAYRMAGRYAEAITAQKQALLHYQNEAPYTELAINYMQQWGAQLNQDPQTLAQALEAARHGVALNDSFWITHAALGSVYLWQKQYEQAIAEMKRAIVLYPNQAVCHAILAEVLSRMGRDDEALRAAKQALHLKSIIADLHLYPVGVTYTLAGRYMEAVAPLQQFLTHYPNILSAHLTLATVYSELGKEAEARAEAAEVLRLNPNFSLEVHQQRTPIKDPTVLERQLAALHKAGLK
jgi:adenylate cyclase